MEKFIIPGLILAVVIAIFILTSGRRKKPAKEAEDDGIVAVREVQGWLAAYFGTNRPEGYRPDPVAEARKILKFLAPMDGQPARMLRQRALEMLDARHVELPLVIENNSVEYTHFAMAIGAVSRQWAAWEYETAT